MQPFASNDTYICPDCGAEVRVGARRCPGCGPFKPLNADDDADQGEFELTGVMSVQRRQAPVSTKRRLVIWYLTFIMVLTVLALMLSVSRVLEK